MAVDGVAPDAETIASGDYAVSRPLFIYVKNAHRGVIPGLDEFLTEYVSEESLRPGRLPARARPDPARATRSATRSAPRSPRAPRWTASTDAVPRSGARAPRAAPSAGGTPVIGYLFLTILALSLVAYVVGGRRRAASSAPAASRLHSLPSYHGAFVAIWVGVPALVLVLLWLLLQGSVIDGLLLRSLPDGADRRRRRRAAVSLILSEIHNVAAGRIFAEPTPGGRRRRRAAAAAGRRSRGSRCSSSALAVMLARPLLRPRAASRRASAPATASSARCRSS